MKLSLVALGFVGVATGLLAVGCATAPVDHAPPAGVAAGADPSCGATPLEQGCSQATNTAAPSGKVDTSTTSVTSTPHPSTPDTGDVCTPKTCEDFQGACGSHDDGCGGTFSCGACESAADTCVPKTCTDLKQTCGNHDNGCNGTVSCGTCATVCATDSKEPNDTDTKATDLGALTDSDDKTITTMNLDSSDGDTDWFTLAVTDGWNFSNPKIDVTSSDALLQVSVFHECKSLPNYSFCYADGVQDNEFGNGCTANGHTILKADCSGLDESGTALIRVRKTVSDGTCHNYDLTVSVY